MRLQTTTFDLHICGHLTYILNKLNFYSYRLCKRRKRQFLGALEGERSCCVTADYDLLSQQQTHCPKCLQGPEHEAVPSAGKLRPSSHAPACCWDPH